MKGWDEIIALHLSFVDKEKTRWKAYLDVIFISISWSTDYYYDDTDLGGRTAIYRGIIEGCNANTQNINKRYTYTYTHKYI